ncbi:hypothetical protein AAF712_008968 [Marasmius tenuissimus]|uniref:Uncharacterized protein n=1 Tax=Marasmius tenuissimus TaxID=585030 RepID=A0ABR2ZRW0_9AGAR
MLSNSNRPGQHYHPPISHAIIAVPPTYIEAHKYQVARLRASLRLEDNLAARALNYDTRHTRDTLVTVNNYLGQRYDRLVHGSLNTIDIGINSLQFVYWGTYLGPPKYLFGWTIMPSTHPPPPSQYEWWTKNVEVYGIDRFGQETKLEGDQVAAMRGSGHNVVSGGGRLRIRVKVEGATTGHVERLIVIEPVGGDPPLPIIARARA